MAIEGTGKVSWNIAASQSQFVFYLIKKSINYYQFGHLSKWYWSLSCLREMINYSLKHPERNDLDKLEVSIQHTLKYWSKYQKMLEEHTEKNMTKEEEYKKNLFSIYVKKYQRKIMDLLNNLGYFPSKEDRTKLSF